MIMQKWHAATTTWHSYTLAYLISRNLIRPRVSLRYSVQSSSYFE